MDQAQLIGIVLGVGGLGLLALLAFVKSHIVICQPNEVVILSGRSRKLPSGEVQGYRVLRGGRGFRWPFLESVARIPMTTQSLEMHLTKVLCAGMIPVSIEARANVKLAGSAEQGLDAAIERFLGKQPDAIVKTARQNLEGGLRGVIATVSPEDANARRLELAAEVADRARGEFLQLGIVLGLFQIQEISDDHGYLEAIGRQRNATVQRDARIAEAEADADSRKVAADQERLGREAEIAAGVAILELEESLAVGKANVRAESNRAEQRAEVAGEIARTEAEIQLEEQRVELSGKREEARTVIPARARREALLLEAEGKAARILENGKATASAVEKMSAQWDGGASRDLFAIQLFPDLLDKMTRVIADNLRIDKLTVLDGGDGEGLPNYVKSLTGSAVALMEQLENATGVDLARIARREDGKESGAKVPKELG
jgi:flotillin